MGDLHLDFYESENSETRWCWKYGLWSSEEYDSEFLARQAQRSKALVFSQTDRYNGYEAALFGALVNFGHSPPFDYWIIANTWVFEPDLSGNQLGETSAFTLPVHAKVLHISDQQFKMMVDAFEEEHGYHPGT